MRPRAWAALLGSLVVLAPVARTAAAEPDEDDLRPGLIATYQDGSAEVVQLEPTIALALGEGETPHPSLAAAGSARWEGYLKVHRGGTYRFSAHVRGRLHLTVAGKEVLTADAAGSTAALHQGPEVRLEAGVHSLVAEFSRPSGAARVEVFWQASHFRREPLPYNHLAHLPKDAPAGLTRQRRIDRGRFLAEEHNCVGCHRPAAGDRLANGLTGRQGPDLSRIGERVHAGWLYRWLAAPAALRLGAAMPKLFSDDEAGSVERFAVASYLGSLGGPVRASTKPRKEEEVRAMEVRGRRLFTSLGCVACHRESASHARTPEPSFLPRPTLVPLKGMTDKTTAERLIRYLQNPLAVDPAGRMPHMLLQEHEARELAYFLCPEPPDSRAASLPPEPAAEALAAAFLRAGGPADQLDAFRRLPASGQVHDLGRRLVVAKGCTGCHTIAPSGRPVGPPGIEATFADLKKMAKHEAGCLAPSSQHGRVPAFAFDDRDRADIRLFLAKGTSGPESAAPAFVARVALQRFNCLACHSRDGEGGLTPELVEELRRYDKAENAEAVSPPPLTDVARKLRTSALRGVLTGAVRVRPWMGLRMPQFGEAQVGRLAEGLAALEGVEPDDAGHPVALTTTKIEAGRHLIGKNAFGCVSCHDLAGVPNAGTRGPDLALTPQRVRYDWYRRWLEQAQRMQPGTRMPSVFPDGKSPLEQVLGGSADAQAEALWAYLSLGARLPLPDGLEPPKGLTLTVKDGPVLLRTFLPDAGARGVAVGYPNGVSLAFDAVACRVAYAWSGNFLDASPVWNDRGGRPAGVLGPRFWTAPAGPAWAVTTSAEPPDFGALARDPAHGAGVPEGQLHEGPRQLRFEGYTLDAASLPTFRYRLRAAEAVSVGVSEHPEPLRAPAGVGLARRFSLELPARLTAWMQAAEAKGEPRLAGPKGETLPLDLKSGQADLPAAGPSLVLPQEGGHVAVLAATAVPEGSRWLLRRQGSGWQVLLRLPMTSAPGRAEVSLRLWVPYRDEPGLVKELLGSNR